MIICSTNSKFYSYEVPYKCNTKRKTILVNSELVNVVKKFIECGLKVRHTSCETHKMHLGQPESEKVTLIQIEFGSLYPDDMFVGVPPEWLKYEFRIADKSSIGYTIYSGISYSERHPIGESDDESIELAKRIMISNLESWLDSIDPEGFKAIWKLAGIL